MKLQRDSRTVEFEIEVEQNRDLLDLAKLPHVDRHRNDVAIYNAIKQMSQDEIIEYNKLYDYRVLLSRFYEIRDNAVGKSNACRAIINEDLHRYSVKNEGFDLAVKVFHNDMKLVKEYYNLLASCAHERNMKDFCNVVTMFVADRL